MSARRKTLLFSDQLPSQDDPEVVDDGAEKRRRLSSNFDFLKIHIFLFKYKKFISQKFIKTQHLQLF